MPERAAEEYADYRLVRLLTVGASRLTVATLFLVLWNLALYRHRETLIFLLTTAVWAALASLVAATTAYVLYKRRGGRVEKSAPPPGLRTRV